MSDALLITGLFVDCARQARARHTSLIIAKHDNNNNSGDNTVCVYDKYTFALAFHDRDASW